MKHLKWLSAALAICLCFCLACPVNADARANKESDAKMSKNTEKKASSQRAKLAEKSDVKKQKTASVKSKTKTSKSRQKKLGASRQDRASKAKPVTSERDVWLKRAKESEVLLSGKASWYGKDFHNKATASGLTYDMYTFTAAHRTLPMGTVVKVTEQRDGKSVMVCVTDRGPYTAGRIIDLSYAAADELGLKERGVGSVKLEVVSDEKGMPLKRGQAYFVKYGSTNDQGKVGPFEAFADAAAMHEALRQAHPDAKVVLDKSSERK